jgi:hypothetical protein
MAGDRRLRSLRSPNQSVQLRWAVEGVEDVRSSRLAEVASLDRRAAEDLLGGLPVPVLY